jgi:hypothetical protein
MRVFKFITEASKIDPLLASPLKKGGGIKIKLLSMG